MLYIKEYLFKQRSMEEKKREENTASREMDIAVLEVEIQAINTERIILLEKLNASQLIQKEINEQMDHLFTVTKTCSVYLDLNLNIMSFTPGALEYFMIGPKDIGRPITDLNFKLIYDTLVRDINDVIATSNSKELVLRSIDQRWFNMDISLFQKDKDAIEGVIITLTAITNLKKINGQPLNNEVSLFTTFKKSPLLSDIYNNSQMSVFVVNVTLQGDYIYEGINPSHEKILGLTNNEVAGKSPKSLIPYFGDEAVRYIYQLYDECVRKQTTIKSEYFVPQGTAKGWWLTTLTPLFDQKGRVDKLIGNGIIITALKEKEAALLKSKRNL